MSAGHHAHQFNPGEHAKIVRAVRALMVERKFQTALRQYRYEDNGHRVIFLAGSNNKGDTIFYDRDLPATIRVEKRGGGFVNCDPRIWLWWHEAVEGVLIRCYDFDYAKAHKWATAVERWAVERAGPSILGPAVTWASYSAALEPYIRNDEKDAIGNSPRDLLLEAYRGTKYLKGLERLQGSTANDNRKPDPRLVSKERMAAVPLFARAA